MTAPSGCPAATGRWRSLLLVAILALAVSGCGQSREPLHKTQLLAMGTLVNISIWSPDAALAQRAVTAVTQELNDAHERWHAWQPSTLTRLNDELAAGKTATVDDDTRELIQQARELSTASQHLFNPAIGGLIELWGFHSDQRPDTPPPSQQINQLLASAPSLADVQVDGKRVRSTNSAVQLDFGAIAKGYAVDRAMQRLRQMDVRNAIVNAGGDLRAIGRHGERPWRIGIRHPTRSGVLASLETHGDESVFTSGDYERYFEYNDKRYHHIIDPRTGYPARGITSVTVVHSEATTADAAATALFVAGPEKWQAIAKSLGISHVMVVDDTGTVYMTPAMAERIQFETDPAPETVIVSP